MTTTGCPVTVWPKLSEPRPNPHGSIHLRGHRCGEPIAPGALFCAKHEGDRIRLSGGGDAA